MFTGLIREVATVAAVDGSRIEVASAQEAAVGDSVAIDGVCLTVVAAEGGMLAFDVVPETLSRTALGGLEPGDVLNLEPSLRVGDRLGGHVVQGHVDGVGKLISFDRISDSENWWLNIELPDEVEKYTVYKGSISIEGISLTIAKLEKNRCTIAIIPHTVEMTNLHSLKPGDPVNLEADLIAKYVEKMMKGDASQSALTIEDLVEQGF